jgi:hypothetical protein
MNGELVRQRSLRGGLIYVSKKGALDIFAQIWLKGIHSCK